jgi:protein-disulfide isomerase
VRKILATVGIVSLIAVALVVGLRSLAPPSAAVAAALTKEAILDDPLAPKVAPPGYDVTVAIFSDYQCPACRKTHPAVEALIAQDPKVRVVYRDWAIFGAASEAAARAAIASQWQGKHRAFNDRLMRTPGKLNNELIQAAAQAAGVDWQRLQADMQRRKPEIDALLRTTNMQATALGLMGTPGLLIGPYIVPGGMDAAGLREAVAMARANQASLPKTKAR